MCSALVRMLVTVTAVSAGVGCGDGPAPRQDVGVDGRGAADGDVEADASEADVPDADAEDAQQQDAGLCPRGFARCTEEDGVTRCVDVDSSACHCGACGLVCPSCEGGECGVCEFGLVLCRPAVCTAASGSELACVNLSSDDRNCGECFHACAPGEVCIRYECVGSLDAGGP